LRDIYADPWAKVESWSFLGDGFGRGRLRSFVRHEESRSRILRGFARKIPRSAGYT
jgi:hypothetical protein